MPLTAFQQRLLADLAAGSQGERYLAGGAAMHILPNSARYSDDLDFFHDSERRVAEAFAADRALLERLGYGMDLELSLPGFVRAVVSRDDDATRVDWAHDSAWRFMPLVQHPLGGWLLHPVDLAVNKTLALAGRDEARDFVDMLQAHHDVLPLPGLVWAATGKDPGLTPLSLLELLKRRGRYRPEQFERLHLARPFDLRAAKTTWLAALDAAESFALERTPEEVGCLFYQPAADRFVIPESARTLAQQGVVPHFGAPGGVVPRPLEDQSA